MVDAETSIPQDLNDVDLQETKLGLYNNLDFATVKAAANDLGMAEITDDEIHQLVEETNETAIRLQIYAKDFLLDVLKQLKAKPQQ
jgi:hypothetical protein